MSERSTEQILELLDSLYRQDGADGSLGGFRILVRLIGLHADALVKTAGANWPRREALYTNPF